MSNTFTKFIDSCVGAIARKVQDEFDESKHPRDKGGRFSSKGGKGKGEGGLHHAGKDVEKYGKDLETKHKEIVEKQKARRGASELEETDFEKEAKQELSEYVGMDRKEMEQLRSEIIRKQEHEPYGSDKVHKYQKQISELTKLINRAKNSEDEDDDDSVSESGDDVDTVYSQARNYMSTNVEDLTEYAEDDGYEAELLSDEFMLLSRNGKQYRAHIDKAGSSYYIDNVEEW